MKYIKVGLAVYFISFFLLFIGLYLVERFLIPGFIVLWIGTVLIAVGIMKRDRLLHYANQE